MSGRMDGASRYVKSRRNVHAKITTNALVAVLGRGGARSSNGNRDSDSFEIWIAALQFLHWPLCPKTARSTSQMLLLR
jgi:hypothetical protein